MINWPEMRDLQLSFFKANVPNGIALYSLEEVESMLDNNLNNLRWVTRSENCKNLGMREDREVKYIGVRKVKNKIKKPYRSETTFNNKKYHVGYFDSEEEAYEAYKKFNLEKFEIEII